MRRSNKKFLIIALTVVVTIVIIFAITLPIVLTPRRIEGPVEKNDQLNEITEMNIDLSLANETMIISLISTQKDDLPLFSFTINNEIFYTSIDGVKMVALDDETYLYSIETNELDFDIDRFVLSEAKWSKLDTDEGSYTKEYNIVKEFEEGVFFEFKKIVGAKNNYYNFQNNKEFALSFYNPLNFKIEIEKEGSENIIYDRQTKVGDETYVYYKIEDLKETTDLAVTFKNVKYYKKDNDIHSLELSQKFEAKYFAIDISFDFEKNNSEEFYIGTKQQKVLTFKDAIKPTFAYYYLNDKKDQVVKSSVCDNTFDMDLMNAAYGKNTLTFIALEYQGEEYLNIEEKEYEFEARYLPIELSMSNISSETNLFGMPTTLTISNPKKYAIESIKIGTEENFLVYQKEDLKSEEDMLYIAVTPKDEYLYILEVVYIVDDIRIEESNLNIKMDMSSLKLVPNYLGIEVEDVYVGDSLSFKVNYSENIEKCIKTIKIDGKEIQNLEKNCNSVFASTDIIYANEGYSTHAVEIVYVTETKEEIELNINIKPVVEVKSFTFDQIDAFVYKLNLVIDAREDVHLDRIKYVANILVDGEEINLEREPVIVYEGECLYAYVTVLENYPNYVEGLLSAKTLVYSIEGVEFSLVLDDNLFFVVNDTTF